MIWRTQGLKLRRSYDTVNATSAVSNESQQGLRSVKNPTKTTKQRPHEDQNEDPGEIPWTLQIFLDAFKWVLDVLEGSSLLGVWSKAKTTKIIFIHISVFVSFLPIHIETQENGLNYLNLGMRMCES